MHQNKKAGLVQICKSNWPASAGHNIGFNRVVFSGLEQLLQYYWQLPVLCCSQFIHWVPSSGEMLQYYWPGPH